MMMTDNVYNLLDVQDNLLLGKAGNMTLSFRIEGPEAYSLSPDEIDERNAMLREAFNFLPEGTFVHKQDIFLRRTYKPVQGNSFLDRADARYFSGRPYLEHRSMLHITLTGLASLEKSYAASPFNYKKELHQKDLARVEGFLEAVENAFSILCNIPGTSFIPMNREGLLHYLEEYANLFGDENAVRDLHFGKEMNIGTDTARYICLCDETFLPEGRLDSAVKDRSLSQSGSNLYHAPLEALGVYLPCNHIVNQVIFLQGNGELQAKVDRNIRVYGSNSSMASSVKVQYEHLSALQKEMLEGNETLVRSFFSICLFDKDAREVERAEKKVREILNLSGFKYYIPSYEHLAAVHLGAMPGQATCLPENFLFLGTLSVSLCLWMHCTTFRNDDEGIFVHDRLFQVPLRKDIWDAGKKRVPPETA